MPRWKRTFYTAFVAQACAMIGFSFVLPFLPFYIQELGVSGPKEAARWAGIAFAITPLSLAASAPIWGILADRYGRKSMLLRSMFGGAIILTLMAFVQNIGQLLVCRVMQGLLTGTVTASIALVASVVPARRSGQALGMMQSAVFLGTCIGPLIGGVAADYVGYRVTFFAGAFMLLSAGLLVAFVAREDFTPPAPNDRKAQGNYAEVFASSGIVIAILTLMTIRFANACVAPVFPLFVREVRGPAPGLNTVTGVIYSAAGLTAAIATVFLGRLVDRWGHNKMLAVFGFHAGIFACAHALSQSTAHILIARMLFGAAIGGTMVAVNVLIKNITQDKNIGKAYGATTAISALGWSVGALSGGYLGAQWGLRAPFVLSGTFLLLAAALAAWRQRRSQATGAG